MPENDLGILLGIAGFVVGLIGIIVSVFLYFRSKNKKILEYKMNSTQLITKKMTGIPKLKVTIDDHPVKTLASTTIQFFNAGNQSIVFSDFAIKEPLGISITGCLHSYDVSADNPNSTPDLQPFDDKTFYVKFDFLKQKQSFSITLLHDGTVTVFGELTNGTRRECRSYLGAKRELRSLVTDRSYWYMCSTLGVSVAAFADLITSAIEPNYSHLIDEFYPIKAIGLLLLVPLTSELFLYSFRKILKK